MNNTATQKKYRVAVRRPVAVTMFFITLIVFGWKSYQQLPVNLMPNISYPTLTVRTEYEGAAPEDVEKLVTRPLEEALSIVGGLVEISSVSTPSISEISLEFTWGTDMNLALQEVRDRLDLFDPPKEVTEKPIILRYDPSLDPVMRIAITGSNFDDVADPVKRTELETKELTAIREAAERHVKGDLEAQSGIAQVLVKGGRQQEIQVSVDAERLKDIGISLNDVANGLAQQNINLSGGRLREGKTEYLVRTLNEYRDPAEIANTIVTSAKGQKVMLSDVAEVKVGEKQRETIVHINGKEAVALDIFKEGDANTVVVCNKLMDVFGFPREKTLGEKFSDLFAEAQTTRVGHDAVVQGGSLDQLVKMVLSRLPKNAEFSLISDQSRFIKGAIKEAQSAAILGGVLALLVIFLFLHKINTTIIIGLAIPISLIATFCPMYMWGITLNVMSLGGLALAVGHLVDDSIIVLESIYRCTEEGDTGLDAIERGVKEILSADVSTTITNIVVFLPIAFVQGVAGQIFGNFAFTMTFSLIASLVTALYLDPMLASLGRFKAMGNLDRIWFIRAYQTALDEGAGGRLSAMAKMIPISLRFVGIGIKDSAQQAFGPSVNSLRELGQGVSLRRLCVGVLALCAIPFVAVLFVLQLLITLLSTLFLMALFIIAITMLGTFLLSGGVLKVVLWAPLSIFNIVFASVKYAYSKLLRVALQFGPVVLLVMAGLAGHSWYLTNYLGRELIPPLKQGEFSIRMQAPPGTRLEETEKLADKIEEVLLNNPKVASVGVEIGIEKSSTKVERGENIAQFNILLRDPEENAQHQDDIVAELRTQIMTVSSEQITFVFPTLFSFKTAVELEIRGDDLEELKRVGARALEAVRDIPGLKDAELSVKRGYPEVIIELDRDLLASKNLSPIQVAQKLRTEIQGDVATRFSQGGERIDIRVRSDQTRLQTIQDLRSLSIVDGNPPIPLSSVANISIQDGPSEIRRIDQRQVVLIQGNVEGFDLGSVSREIEKRMQHVEKPDDFSFVLGGQNRELQTSYGSLMFALMLSIFLVYVVMACQFESLIQPALIMFTIPLGFIGVIDALYLLDMPLSIAVFMGGILLVGIVVNNSMLLVDYANQLRKRGRTRREAIYESGLVRFRPVLMTAITTIIGAVPMALSGGDGSELRKPLAVTVIAGLTVATMLTLVIIPVVYDLFGGRDKR
ncbi:MAG TPA: efflux RND transporter permease subunit [Candidatus Hydrogenedentes bacterium]|nr:efflux RND transporter permease subunit [Candidatus Hydrogenedentota bacterium]